MLTKYVRFRGFPSKISMLILAAVMVTTSASSRKMIILGGYYRLGPRITMIYFLLMEQEWGDDTYKHLLERRKRIECVF